ncbi:unnamed protein product [Clonostachys chloroleuca]|uniref:Uncharacterized protein n=1 Tax=Clonostachys chloroleuca TaxID=1926264 RepID=A0AA35QCT5_9HYPO|nr:unnamed protein product [Clonostachys chloroleuca]
MEQLQEWINKRREEAEDPQTGRKIFIIPYTTTLIRVSASSKSLPLTQRQMDELLASDELNMAKEELVMSLIDRDEQEDIGLNSTQPIDMSDKAVMFIKPRPFKLTGEHFSILVADEGHT